MNDKYLSEGFEGDIPTQPDTKTTASRIVFLPKGILMPLIVILACVSIHVCSKASAEQQAMVNTEIDRTDQTVQEMSIAKTPEDQLRKKKVLVLHALKIKRPWNALFNRYFVEALQEINFTLENIEIESLDLLQFKDANYQEIVKKQLEHKYADLKPDIIIITFASTIEFILENNLFPDIPKIFILPTPSDFEEIPNSVMLPFAHEFKENIDHALTLLPDTKSIYVIAGNGLMDRRLLSLFQDRSKELRNRVSFHYLDDLSVEELLRRIDHLPDDSFIYYLTYSLDFQGKAVITRDFSKRIAEHSNRPVFSWLDLHALGIGILGGRVTTTRSSATMSADIVKRIFEGESIDSIKPKLPYVEYIYEWKELEKWGIDPKKLPPGSVIQNRPINFFEVFKLRIIGGIALLIIEALLILLLLINIRKRKTIEQRYRTVADFTYDWEWWRDPDGRYIYVSPSCERVTGYKQEEFIDKTHLIDEIILPEDRSTWDEHNRNAQSEHKLREIQFRIKRKDGVILWIEHACQPVKDNDGKFLGFRASNRDITSRKKAEEAVQKSQDSLRFLAGKLITAQEEERRRLAREMHDDLTQRLALLAIKAGKLEIESKEQDNPVFAQVQEMKEEIIKLSKDIHDISRQIHPAILDDLGLVDAIKSECDAFTQREEINVEYEANSVPLSIPRNVKICIYRIIQESLRNIAKHAGTDKAYVSLTCSDGNLFLTIRDNGIGFDTSHMQGQKGIGLTSIEERVRLIQGEFSVQSEPGESTVIKVKAPCAKEQE